MRAPPHGAAPNGEAGVASELLLLSSFSMYFLGQLNQQLEVMEPNRSRAESGRSGAGVGVDGQRRGLAWPPRRVAARRRGLFLAGWLALLGMRGQGWGGSEAPSLRRRGEKKQAGKGDRERDEKRELELRDRKSVV